MDDGERRQHDPRFKRIQAISIMALGLLVMTILSLKEITIPFSSSQHHLKSRNLQTTTIKDTLTAKPSIAWLASYPHSGTNYLRKIIHSTAATTMATNYKHTVEGKVYTSAPYILRTDLDLPTSNLLTETHCSGTCLTCDAEKDYVEKNLEIFRESCAAPKHGDYPLYDPTKISAVVHLIRNPFDNVVVRFLNERNNYMRANKGAESGWKYESNRKGLQEWCSAVASQTAVVTTMGLNDEMRAIVREVPCFALFYQYVMWHNNIYDLIRVYSLRFKELHYDDLNSPNQDLKKDTVFKLSHFLDLNMAKGPWPNLPKENYAEFFNQDDRKQVSSFLKVLAARDFWANMRRYVPDPPPFEDRYRAVGGVLSPHHYGSWPEVIWAMTFPNSGTHYIVDAVIKASGDTAAATNYRIEAGADHTNVPNFALTPNGPYRYHDHPFPEKYVITKTHCLRCHNCDPGSSELIIGWKDFMGACSSGWHRDDETGNMVQTPYAPSITKKVVHLIRDPMDNIVANFHFKYKDMKKRGKQWRFEYTPEGFREFCKLLNSKHTHQDLVDVYGEKAAAVAPGVLCHGEIFQYVQWHNNAFKTERELNVPSLIIYYEDFHFDMEGNMDKIFKFFEMERVTDPHPFKYVPYPDHFSEEEVLATKRFIMLLADDVTRGALSRYLGGWMP